jgi:hypothetical protein
VFSEGHEGGQKNGDCDTRPQRIKRKNGAARPPQARARQKFENGLSKQPPLLPVPREYRGTAEEGRKGQAQDGCSGSTVLSHRVFLSPNKPLHLYQIELYFRLVLSMCFTSQDLVRYEMFQIFAVNPLEREA